MDILFSIIFVCWCCWSDEMTLEGHGNSFVWCCSVVKPVNISTLYAVFVMYECVCIRETYGSIRNSTELLYILNKVLNEVYDRVEQLLLGLPSWPRVDIELNVVFFVTRLKPQTDHYGQFQRFDQSISSSSSSPSTMSLVPIFPYSPLALTMKVEAIN